MPQGHEYPCRVRLYTTGCVNKSILTTRFRHYVAFIRKKLGEQTSWVLFNDEKVVKVEDVEEMKKFAYVYFFKRV